jgi:hypothetical protein
VTDTPKLTPSERAKKAADDRWKRLDPDERRDATSHATRERTRKLADIARGMEDVLSELRQVNERLAAIESSREQVAA